MRGRARSETQAAGRYAHASTLSSQLLRASRAYLYARMGVSWYQVACLDAIELHVLHVLREVVSRRRLSRLGGQAKLSAGGQAEQIAWQMRVRQLSVGDRLAEARSENRESLKRQEARDKGQGARG